MKDRLSDLKGIAKGLAEGLAKERTSPLFKQVCASPKDALVTPSVARSVLQKIARREAWASRRFPNSLRSAEVWHRDRWNSYLGDREGRPHIVQKHSSNEHWLASGLR